VNLNTLRFSLCVLRDKLRNPIIKLSSYLPEDDSLEESVELEESESDDDELDEEEFEEVRPGMCERLWPEMWTAEERAADGAVAGGRAFFDVIAVGITEK
jgi:hypothetical protein